MLIKYNFKTIYDELCKWSLKIRIEVELPVKGSRTYALWFLKIMSLRYTIASLLRWVLTIVKVMDEIQAMTYSKINNHTSMKSKKATESKTQAIASTKKLLQGSSHRSISPPSPLWKISLSSKGSCTNGPYTKNYNLVYTRPEYITPPLSPLHKR